MQEANKEKLDLSIIIVNWNTKEFLKQCLQSVYETTLESTFDVFVIDNGSSDGSPEMVKKEYPHVNLICTHANLGFAKANNIGIKRSTGRYICLVNSDIIMRNDCADIMCSYMDHHPSVGVLGPRILNPDLTLQPSCKGFPNFWNTLCRALALDTMFPKSKFLGGNLMRFWPHDTIHSVDAIVGCFLMVRRKALEEIGLLDENFFMYGEDIDWCKRFRTGCWEIVYFPDAEAIHYGGMSSSKDPVKFYIELKRCTLLYWKKHHGRIGKIYIYFIMLLYETVRIIRGLVLYIIKSSERKKFKYKVKRSIANMCWLLHISNHT